SKQDLADAAINQSSEVDAIAMVSGMEDLRRRLELLTAPPAPVDESQKRAVLAETTRLHQRREALSAASGQLISAALTLAGGLISEPGSPPPSAESVDRLTKRLSECVDTDSEGRPQLTIS